MQGGRYAARDFQKSRGTWGGLPGKGLLLVEEGQVAIEGREWRHRGDIGGDSKGRHLLQCGQNRAYIQGP